MAAVVVGGAVATDVAAVAVVGAAVAALVANARVGSHADLSLPTSAVPIHPWHGSHPDLG